MSDARAFLRKATIAGNLLYIVFILFTLSYIISALAKYGSFSLYLLILVISVAIFITLMALSTYLISSALLHKEVKRYLKIISLTGNVLYIAYASYYIVVNGLSATATSLVSWSIAIVLFVLNTYLVAAGDK